MDNTTIERYASGAVLPAQAMTGLTPSEIDSFPIPGTWSIRQLILHLMDSDLIASYRMKRLIAEDNPLITAYDETRFTQRLHYDALDVSMAAEIFRLNRLMTVEILRRTSPPDWKRSGVHTERGKVTLAELVTGYVDHLDHHLRFLREKRQVLGKPWDR